MNIVGILKDSLRYPLSDWKKILILGIILIITDPTDILESLGIGMAFLFNFGIIGLIFGVLSYGYLIRILKASLAGFAELPYFNSLFDMIIDGIKVIIAGIVYTIPLILIIVFGALSLGLTAENIGINNVSILLEILIIITLLYLVIAFPIFLMSLANMAFYDSNLEAAFKFREIINRIASIGWGAFIIWYITNIIVFLILIVIGALIEVIFYLVLLKIIGVLLVSLIVIPYIIIYLFRSTALFYLSEDQGYLECKKCGGYYELQPGESPEDPQNLIFWDQENEVFYGFDKCQCGGNLKYNKQSVPSKDKQSFMGRLKSLNKKQSLIIVGILAIIIGIPIIFAQHMPLHLINTNSTLIGTYNVSSLDTKNPGGTLILIPPGTTDIKIEYNLSWTPVSTGTNYVDISGYNTNVTGWDSLPDNINVIYNKGISLFDDYENKTGTLNLDNPAIKSLVISGNGVNGTIKIYAIKRKLAILS